MKLFFSLSCPGCGSALIRDAGKIISKEERCAVPGETNRKNEISREERQIIDMIRELHYGELIIQVKNGQPVRVEMKKSISLKEAP